MHRMNRRDSGNHRRRSSYYEREDYDYGDHEDYPSTRTTSDYRYHDSVSDYYQYYQYQRYPDERGLSKLMDLGVSPRDYKRSSSEMEEDTYVNKVYNKDKRRRDRRKSVLPGYQMKQDVQENASKKLNKETKRASLEDFHGLPESHNCNMNIEYGRVDNIKPVSAPLIKFITEYEFWLQENAETSKYSLPFESDDVDSSDKYSGFYSLKFCESCTTYFTKEQDVEIHYKFCNEDCCCRVCKMTFDSYEDLSKHFSVTRHWTKLTRDCRKVTQTEFMKLCRDGKVYTNEYTYMKRHKGVKPWNQKNKVNERQDLRKDNINASVEEELGKAWSSQKIKVNELELTSNTSIKLNISAEQGLKKKPPSQNIPVKGHNDIKKNVSPKKDPEKKMLSHKTNMKQAVICSNSTNENTSEKQGLAKKAPNLNLIVNNAVVETNITSNEQKSSKRMKSKANDLEKGTSNKETEVTASTSSENTNSINSGLSSKRINSKTSLPKAAEEHFNKEGNKEPTIPNAKSLKEDHRNISKKRELEKKMPSQKKEMKQAVTCSISTNGNFSEKQGLTEEVTNLNINVNNAVVTNTTPSEQKSSKQRKIKTEDLEKCTSNKETEVIASTSLEHTNSINSVLSSKRIDSKTSLPKATEEHFIKEVPTIPNVKSLKDHGNVSQKIDLEKKMTNQKKMKLAVTCSNSTNENFSEKQGLTEEVTNLTNTTSSEQKSSKQRKSKTDDLEKCMSNKETKVIASTSLEHTNSTNSGLSSKRIDRKNSLLKAAEEHFNKEGNKEPTMPNAKSLKEDHRNVSKKRELENKMPSQKKMKWAVTCSISTNENFSGKQGLTEEVPNLNINVNNAVVETNTTSSEQKSSKQRKNKADDLVKCTSNRETEVIARTSLENTNIINSGSSSKRTDRKSSVSKPAKELFNKGHAQPAQCAKSLKKEHGSENLSVVRKPIRCSSPVLNEEILSDMFIIDQCETSAVTDKDSFNEEELEMIIKDEFYDVSDTEESKMIIKEEEESKKIVKDELCATLEGKEAKMIVKEQVYEMLQGDAENIKNTLYDNCFMNQDVSDGNKSAEMDCLITIDEVAGDDSFENPISPSDSGCLVDDMLDEDFEEFAINIKQAGSCMNEKVPHKKCDDDRGVVGMPKSKGMVFKDKNVPYRPQPKSVQIAKLEGNQHLLSEYLKKQDLTEQRSFIKLKYRTENCPGCMKPIDARSAVLNTVNFHVSVWCKICKCNIIFIDFFHK